MKYKSSKIYEADIKSLEVLKDYLARTKDIKISRTATLHYFISEKLKELKELFNEDEIKRLEQ